MKSKSERSGEMKKQIAKLVYVWLVRFFSFLSRRTPVKEKLVYLMSFPKNENGLLESFIDQNPTVDVVLFYEEPCKKEADKFKSLGVAVYPITLSLKDIKAEVFELMQAKVILCDNYFPILAGLFPQKETTIIQLWHANGAIKRFGLEDPTAMSRSFFDKIRFKQVYKRFDEYIVGSEMMGKIFQKSYQADGKKIIPLGYPRSDIYFDQVKIQQKRKKFYQAYPELNGKKIVLYAPTYREDKKSPALNIQKMYEVLGSEYAVITKLHPHVVTQVNPELYEGFFYEKMQHFAIEDLLVVAECLITDYSSVPFEFTLLDNAEKIIFYCYDREEYEKHTGIQKDFEEWAPGVIVNTLEKALINIKKDTKTDFKEFNQKWNTYNDGHAKERLIEHIQKKYDSSLS